MMLPAEPTRRALLVNSLILPLAIAASASTDTADSSQRPVGKTLIAYYSRSGNTRVIAWRIHRACGPADLFEIEPANAYPEDYFETVEQARQERDNGYEPPLKTRVPGIANYRTLFLGFPIWGETAPPVIRSFLSTHDLSGKTVIPFITHGGYGLGSSISVLRTHAPKARYVEGFSMLAPQERQTIARVTDWLSGLAGVD
jgi:flavodoxin